MTTDKLKTITFDERVQYLADDLAYQTADYFADHNPCGYKRELVLWVGSHMSNHAFRYADFLELPASTLIFHGDRPNKSWSSHDEAELKGKTIKDLVDDMTSISIQAIIKRVFNQWPFTKEEIVSSVNHTGSRTLLLQRLRLGETFILKGTVFQKCMDAIHYKPTTALIPLCTTSPEIQQMLRDVLYRGHVSTLKSSAKYLHMNHKETTNAKRREDDQSRQNAKDRAKERLKERASEASKPVTD